MSCVYPNPRPWKNYARKWPDKTVEQCPAWCSVDLRDGNQSLPRPMTVEEKFEYFRLLVDLGFKEIEIGFPSASREDYDFVRFLIEDGHIPEDVIIGVLTPCREELIRKTFKAVAGAERALIHAYIASSDLHIENVFNSFRKEVEQKALDSTKLISDLAGETDADIRYQFSPEEFSDSDIDFVLNLCCRVFKTWGRADKNRPLIFNLPATVERVPPNQFADMVEYFSRSFPERDKISVSVHCHNDQGMAVAATEMSLLAGADRVEGDLLGNGERTGNVSLSVVVCNFHCRGLDTGLDLSFLAEFSQKASQLTGMPIPERMPYIGASVWDTFSGSHQDAIRKGFKRIKDLFGENIKKTVWKVPYLFGRPEDVGRSHENLIRINSQSGKGGVRYVLEADHGIEMPDQIAEEMRELIQADADSQKTEITSSRVYEVFKRIYLFPEGPFKLVRYWPRPDENDPENITRGEAVVFSKGLKKTLYGRGNGPIDAFVQAISNEVDLSFDVVDLKEHSISKGKDASAMAYVQIKVNGDGIFWGAGMSTSIDQAAVYAAMSAINRACSL